MSIGRSLGDVQRVNKLCHKHVAYSHVRTDAAIVVCNAIA